MDLDPLYFLTLLISSELKDLNELDVLDLYSSIRLQFSNKKLVSANKLNKFFKFASPLFKNFKMFFANVALPLLFRCRNKRNYFLLVKVVQSSCIVFLNFITGCLILSRKISRES